MFTPDRPANQIRAEELLTGRAKEPGMYVTPTHYSYFPHPERILGDSPEMRDATQLGVDLWTLLNQLIFDPVAGITANGSAVSERIAVSGRHTGVVDRILPLITRPDTHIRDINHLFTTGELEPNSLSPRSEAWRKVLMFMSGPNNDFIGRFRQDRPENMRWLYETILAIQTYCVQSSGHTVSWIDNGKFGFIRLRDPRNQAFSGINVIGLHKSFNDSYSSATTLRHSQAQRIKWDRDGMYIGFEPTDYDAKVEMKAAPETLGLWLNSVSRTIRAMTFIGLPIGRLDIGSFLERVPDNDIIAFNEMASIVANLTVSALHDQYLSEGIIQRIGLDRYINNNISNRANILFDFMVTQNSIFGDVNASDCRHISELFARFLPVQLEAFYNAVPPVVARDRVIRSDTVPHRLIPTPVHAQTEKLLRETSRQANANF